MNAKVKRIFINHDNSADIIFQDAFDKLGLWNFDLQSYPKELIGFSRGKVRSDGFITLYLTLGTKPLTRTIEIDFLLGNYFSAYYIILGHLTLNKIRAVISTALLTMKFITNDGKVGTIKAD